MKRLVVGVALLALGGCATQRDVEAAYERGELEGRAQAASGPTRIENELDECQSELAELAANTKGQTRSNSGPQTPEQWLAYCEQHLKMDRHLTKRDRSQLGIEGHHQWCVDFKKQFKADCDNAYREGSLFVRPGCEKYRPAADVLPSPSGSGVTQERATSGFTSDYDRRGGHQKITALGRLFSRGPSDQDPAGKDSRIAYAMRFAFPSVGEPGYRADPSSPVEKLDLISIPTDRKAIRSALNTLKVGQGVSWVWDNSKRAVQDRKIEILRRKDYWQCRVYDGVLPSDKR